MPVCVCTLPSCKSNCVIQVFVYFLFVYLTCGEWPRSLDAKQDVLVLTAKEQEEWLVAPEHAQAIKKRKCVSKILSSHFGGPTISADDVCRFI